MSVAPSIVREIAEEAGFDLVAFGPAELGEHARRFLDWLDAGRAGEMEYLATNRATIAEPRRFLPGARSVVSLARDYSRGPVALPGGGRVARYAAGRDYHRSLGKSVKKLRDRLEAAGAPRGSWRGGTDSLPVLERALALRAGIGFLAKSSMIISPTRGPYLLLAELLTTQDLPIDAPAAGSCGTCRACLDACPTGAIVAPFEVDARRCLSYTTIELRGAIPEGLRAAQGDRFFGCDDCLEVCPFTRHGRALPAPPPPDLAPHQALSAFGLVDVLALSQEEYDRDWTGTAMRRATRSGLRRNAAVVLGNLGDDRAVPALTQALQDDDPIVRRHSAWALGRLDRQSPALARALDSEADPNVRAEIERAQGP